MGEIREEKFTGNPTQDQSDDQWANADTYIIKADTLPGTEIEPEQRMHVNRYTETMKAPLIVGDDLKGAKEKEGTLERLKEGEMLKQMKNSAKVTKTRIRKTQQPTRSTDASEIVAKLQSQIQGIEYVGNIQTADIPQMPVKVREILISLQQQIEKLKSETIGKIQAI